MSSFDHHTTDFATSWREQYDELRGTCPVAHTDTHGGFHVVTSYADVRKALVDNTTFVCARDLAIEGVEGTIPGGVTIPTNPFRMGFMEMDEPRHHQLRKIVNPWLSSRSMTEHKPRLGELVSFCLDRITPSGAGDVVDDIANPLPALVTLDLLGLPLESWERYATVLHKAAYREKGSAREVAWQLGDLTEVVQRARVEMSRPESALGALVLAEVDGELLPVEDVVELVFMLLNGGIDTSTALIAHLMLHLDSHHDDRDRLIAEPALVEPFVDEMLRKVTPGTGVARTVAVDTELGGVSLKAGDRILLALGAANNDPEVFPEPETIVVEGRGTSHVAFGTGVHRCVGSFVATTEIVELTQQLLRRIPDFVIERNGVEAYPSIPLVSGFIRMPFTFTPSPALGETSGSLPPARVVSAAARLSASSSRS